MKRVLTAALAVALASCDFGAGNDFKNGIPSAKQVELSVPQKSGQALSGEGTRKDGLEGDTAVFYQLTRGVTVVVNGGTVAVLGLVKLITDQQPTTVTDDTAVWGPHTEALSPNTWKLTVTRVRPNEYTYALDGKGKTEPDSAFRTVLSGAHKYIGQNFGEGTFLLDWDKAQTLPEHDQNVGTATVTYARLSQAADIHIEAVFNQVRDGDTGLRVNANYLYNARPANGGAMEFTLIKDLAPGAAVETTTVNSRWQETGAGRSDVRARGGDLAAEATVSECWDTNFASRFLAVSYDPTRNYGQETTCAFPTAQYARLSL